MRSCHNHAFTLSPHSKIGFGEAERRGGCCRFLVLLKGVPDIVTLSMIDTSLKQAGLLVFCAFNKTWEAVQSCGFSKQQREAGWAVYKGCLVSSRCLRYQATRSHHKNSCVKYLCIGWTAPLHWVLWNIPLGLWILSNKPSSSMGWRGSSVWEWEREEIWVFP